LALTLRWRRIAAPHGTKAQALPSCVVGRRRSSDDRSAATPHERTSPASARSDGGLPAPLMLDHCQDFAADSRATAEWTQIAVPGVRSICAQQRRRRPATGGWREWLRSERSAPQIGPTGERDLRTGSLTELRPSLSAQVPHSTTLGSRRNLSAGSRSPACAVRGSSTSCVTRLPMQERHSCSTHHDREPPFTGREV